MLYSEPGTSCPGACDISLPILRVMQPHKRGQYRRRPAVVASATTTVLVLASLTAAKEHAADDAAVVM
eukprot:3804486-Prymnesium_polylepis.1